jgi:Pentapeptide repeats (8 copies)
VEAKMQGGSLALASLQCVNLEDAELQGASLEFAQLQGALLDGTKLQGASLAGAQLQGASLQRADLHATDLRSALLWRTNRIGKSIAAFDVTPPSDTYLRDSQDQWLPVRRDKVVIPETRPWKDGAYGDLRKQIESLPEGPLRKQALDRIRTVDCSNPDKTLASCDLSVPLPPEAEAWRKLLEHSRVDESAYAKALARALKSLLCSGSEHTLFALRSLLVGQRPSLSRLGQTEAEAPALVDSIMTGDCPISASLTPDDKGRLLQIKQEALHFYPSERP